MALRNLKIYAPSVKIPLHVKSGIPGVKKLLHIGIHNSLNRNAGDTLLFTVVRKVFDTVLGPFDWELKQIWEEFTFEAGNHKSNYADGIVLGGGGLLLCDQDGSDTSNSGWQWDSSVEAVDAIDVPFVIFSIGYNQFRGQNDFEPIFKKHVCSLTEKVGFFGLRNSGSIRALSKHLSPELATTLRRQFCPTNVLWQLYPKYQVMAKNHDKKKEKVLVLNAAFDRDNLRFGDSQNDLLARLAGAIRNAQLRGWQIVVVAHKTKDRDIETYLNAKDVTYDTVDLTDARSEEIMEFYAKVDFVIGMRGHSQMIPFGLRRPIFSIISHDKMSYFLEDISKPEWGVEIDRTDLEQQIETALMKIESDRETIHAEIKNIQSFIWQETCDNLSYIGHKIFGF
jgi:polysaccharide pyruvyl transferase WcaK-like protein